MKDRTIIVYFTLNREEVGGRKTALLVDSDWICSAAHCHAQLLRDQEAHLKFSIFLNLEIHVYVPVVIVRR